jgi:hypothetical protein
MITPFLHWLDGDFNPSDYGHRLDLQCPQRKACPVRRLVQPHRCIEGQSVRLIIKVIIVILMSYMKAVNITYETNHKVASYIQSAT